MSGRGLDHVTKTTALCTIEFLIIALVMKRTPRTQFYMYCTQFTVGESGRQMLLSHIRKMKNFQKKSCGHGPTAIPTTIFHIEKLLLKKDRSDLLHVQEVCCKLALNRSSYVSINRR